MFSERLKELRTERGLKQAEVAEELLEKQQVEVKLQSYSAYENGREPSYALLSAFAKFFNVSTDYLIGHADARNPENIDAMEKYGLSEEALQRLEKARAYKSYEFITRTVNALIENGAALEAIAQYLYFNLPPNPDYNGERIASFHAVYKHGKKGDNFIWGTDEKKLGVYEVHEAMTNEKYKRAVMFDIQERLIDMLKDEDQKEPL